MLLVLAVVGNCIVAAMSFVAIGFNHDGAGTATRNTARFALVFFLIGFAAPGIRNWVAGLPQASALIRAYAAAQFVHFTAVALLHTWFETRLRFGLPEAAIVLLGFTLTAAVAATSAPRPDHRVYTTTHLVLLHFIWLILAADYSQHPEHAMRWMMVPVVSALILRYLPRRASIPQHKAEAAGG